MLCYILRYGEHVVDGVICTSPLLQMRHEVPKWKLWMMKLGFGALDEFQISVLDPFQLCDVPKQCALCLVDPLWQQQMTVQLAHEILTCAELVTTRAHKIGVRLLMLHGDCDSISSHEATSRFWDRVPTQSKRLVIINGGYHELHNDQQGDEWLLQIGTHLTKWIAEPTHIGTRSWQGVCDRTPASLSTLRRATVNSWVILLKRHKKKLLTACVLYIVCGLLKLKLSRGTSLLRVLFWPWFGTWWASQKAFDYADRPLAM